MKKNKTLIFSVVGIILVTLCLLGLTYAYFVTQIQGNENDKSINVTTANLRLTYGDGTGTITANNIIPGITTEAKTFTVKNSGNNFVGNYKVYLENVVNTFTNINDLVINMSCSSDVSNKTCMGVTNLIFPTTNDLLVSNSIDVGETQTYSLTITYKETGVDQSVDMGKQISGKIQIYDARNVVDISGAVVNAEIGDYVELHSDPKTSQINNDKVYKITAVEPGEHTFYIKNKDGEIKGSKTIVINRTNFISHDAAVINITKEVNNIKINVTDINTDLGIEIDNIIENPFNENSDFLTYNIINNSQLNKNRTTYEPDPKTTPGKTNNAVYSYYKKGVATKVVSTSSMSATQQSYYITYSEDYSVNETNGKISLTNPKKCKYNEVDCYQNLIGKYIISSDLSLSMSATDSFKSYDNLKTINIILTAPEPNNSSSINITSNAIYSVPDSAERTLSISEDDEGLSYYFRGDIKDNYVNFNGMCWRIIRIEGDGSTKVILEDKNTTCESSSFTGNYEWKTGYFGYKSVTANDGLFVYKNDFLNYSDNNGFYNRLKDFQETKMSNVLDKLKTDEWCYDDSTYSDKAGTTKINVTDDLYLNKTPFYYGGYKRIAYGLTPSYKCEGTRLSKYMDGITNMKVGTFTIDEVLFSGVNFGADNYNYFLINDWHINNKYIWTMTPMDFFIQSTVSYVRSFYISPGSHISYAYVTSNFSVRPAVVLVKDIKIENGDGTQQNPYIIK